MNDDILKMDPDYLDLKNDPTIQDEIKEIISGNKIEENIKDERKEIDKSDIVILDSNASNNLRSAQTFNLSDFDSDLLWSNGNVNTSFSGQNITLNGSLSDYDYILINYRSNLTSQEVGKVIIPTDSLNTRNVNKSTIVLGSVYQYANTTPTSTRPIFKVDDNTIYIDGGIATANTGNNYEIPIDIYGLNVKTVSTPDPTPTPNPEVTTSGNIINNYYNNYYGVSENSVSWNIMNKPFNEYTVTESYFAISTLLFLGIGIYLIIRRSIFKWR